MKTWALLFACASARASPTSPIILSNNTGGFSVGFTCPFDPNGLECGFGSPGETIVVLNVQLAAQIGSGQLPQFIHETADTDFSTPGYLVDGMSIFGVAEYSGFFTERRRRREWTVRHPILASFFIWGIGRLQYRSRRRSGTIYRFHLRCFAVGPTRRTFRSRPCRYH